MKGVVIESNAEELKVGDEVEVKVLYGVRLNLLNFVVEFGSDPWYGYREHHHTGRVIMKNPVDENTPLAVIFVGELLNTGED
ncbi:hypothetical protein ACENW9_000833 [Escherichia coli]